MLLLLDATRGENAADQAILAQLPKALPRITVMNKIDLVGQAPALERVKDLTKVRLSAKTGAGVGELRQAILQAVGWRADGEGLFMARERHVQALERAASHLESAGRQGGTLELFAEELRLAQEAMGAITGEYTSEDLLGEIFSRFCIGK